MKHIPITVKADRAAKQALARAHRRFESIEGDGRNVSIVAVMLDELREAYLLGYRTRVGEERRAKKDADFLGNVGNEKLRAN